MRTMGRPASEDRGRAAASPCGGQAGRGDAGGAPPRVAVLGGGLAGLAAAVRLADCGGRVTLIETSRRLGGRATSHDDPASGQTLDNCQHVLLGCCTNLIDLYGRLGVDGLIRWDRALHFFDKRGRHDVLAGGPLPAPLHLSGSLLRFRTLSWTEKWQISRAMLAMMRLGAAGRAALHDMSFADWLARHGQSAGAIRRFWSVIIVSALNETPEHASAAAALQVFQEGFLAHRDAYVMGTASVPLRRLYDPAVERIEAAGGSVRLGASVERIGCDEAGTRVTAVRLQGGERIEADAYISALPFDRLARVLAPELRRADDRFAGLDRFEHSPILGIHMWFDPPVLDGPHMIFVDSPLQWVFNKGVVEDAASPSGRAQYLHGVISAADDWVAKPAAEVLEMAVAEVGAYLRGAGPRALVRGRVIKEKRATFSIGPGIDAHRPATTGAVTNLMLAGDWVATGWPATMEGAVRSGYAAAAAALGEPPESGLCPDLSPSGLYRTVARPGSRQSPAPADDAAAPSSHR